VVGIVGAMSHRLEAADDGLLFVKPPDPCRYLSKRIQWDLGCTEEIIVACGGERITLTREDIMSALREVEP
jgi:hypothetical protein